MEQGFAAAQFTLAGMYYMGHAVPQNYQEAIKWFRLAANQDNAVAQYTLGRMYEKGEGVPQDYTEAMKWVRLAAEQGDTTAQGFLGLMYGKGQGMPKDDVLAHMWMNLAVGQREEIAIKTRDTLGKLMTPAQLAEAQRLARSLGKTACWLSDPNSINRRGGYQAMWEGGSYAPAGLMGGGCRNWAIPKVEVGEANCLGEGYEKVG